MISRKIGGQSGVPDEREQSSTSEVGKRTLVEQVQRSAAQPYTQDSSSTSPADIARAGVQGPGARLPHFDEIQASFGRHDVSRVTAHQGPAAAEAAQTLGAEAFAFGDAVAFRSSPDLHTAAHEAAHVIQQSGGVQLEGSIDRPGDSYERDADAVADAVVDGRSAEPLLDRMAHGGSGGSVRAVQRAPDKQRQGGEHAPTITPPTAGINKIGFIDHGDGANLRSGPAEAGGQKVREQPLPPAARVFVSGTHPGSSQWWYITAYLDGGMVRGYVQDFRVTTELPEPTAELYEVKSGDTAEKLAATKFRAAVTDGHDLRFYENVLLYVNQQQGRAGVTGSFQDPNILGHGSNNVQLIAGHRIWLVSAAYAKALESVVPSGSLTGGAVAKAKRFAGHIEDIFKSVNDSPLYIVEVAGQYAQAILENKAEIIGVVLAFLAAEALSALLALVPTGVTQIAAAVIQLGLAAFGAAGAAMAGVQALEHATNWLTLAWTASGNPEKIAAASKEFLRMWVAIAMAALALIGAKGNLTTGMKLLNSLPPGGGLVPAMAVVGGGHVPGSAGGGVIEGVAIGPGTGSLGVGGTLALMEGDKDGGKSENSSGDKKEAGKGEAKSGLAEAEADFAQHAKDVANEAPGRTQNAWRNKLDLGSEQARIQAEGEAVYRDTFREEYLKAREAGQPDAQAMQTARRAASKATQTHVQDEAMKLAQARARLDVARDTNADGVPDAFKNTEPKAMTDFADFKSGTRGKLAKQLAPQLPGKTVAEMEALLQKAGGTRHPSASGTFETVVEGKTSYPQVSYTFPDGTLVRVKPLGDVRNGVEPMYSVEMMSSTPATGSPQNSVAFKLDVAGNPVPKGGSDIANPYTPQQQLQRAAYEQELLRLGHLPAKK